MSVVAAARADVSSLLGRLGLGPRVLKTALAVGLAWWIGNLLGEPRPVFAAVAAVVGLEATVLLSVTRGVEQFLGVLCGLILATVVLDLSGSAPLTLALLVLVSMAVGRRLNLSDFTLVEFAITSMLVVAYTDPTNPSYGLTRVWEGILGSAIAVIVNAMVLPPEYVARLRAQIRAIEATAVSALTESIDGLVDGASAEIVGQRLVAKDDEVRAVTEARPARGRAREALRFSPLRRRSRASVERLASAAEVLENTLGHTMTVVRVCWQHARRHASPPPLRQNPAATALVEFRDDLVVAIHHYAQFADRGDQVALDLTVEALDRVGAQRRAFLRIAEQELAQPGELEARVDLAAVESELEHVLDDLVAAVGEETERLRMTAGASSV